MSDWEREREMEERAVERMWWREKGRNWNNISYGPGSRGSPSPPSSAFSLNLAAKEANLAFTEVALLPLCAFLTERETALQNHVDASLVWPESDWKLDASHCGSAYTRQNSSTSGGDGKAWDLWCLKDSLCLQISVCRHFRMALPSVRVHSLGSNLYKGSTYTSVLTAGAVLMLMGTLKCCHNNSWIAHLRSFPGLCVLSFSNCSMQGSKDFNSSLGVTQLSSALPGTLSLILTVPRASKRSSWKNIQWVGPRKLNIHK